MPATDLTIRMRGKVVQQTASRNVKEVDRPLGVSGHRPDDGWHIRHTEIRPEIAEDGILLNSGGVYLFAAPPLPRSARTETEFGSVHNLCAGCGNTDSVLEPEDVI